MLKSYSVYCLPSQQYFIGLSICGHTLIGMVVSLSMPTIHYNLGLNFGEAIWRFIAPNEDAMVKGFNSFVGYQPIMTYFHGHSTYIINIGIYPTTLKIWFFLD